MDVQITNTTITPVLPNILKIHLMTITLDEISDDGVEAKAKHRQTPAQKNKK